MLFNLSPSSEQLNLICLPFAGGHAGFYGCWNEHLGADVMIHPAHLPGRGLNIRMPALTDMETLCSLLIQDMEIFRNMRFAWVGTSMGGWIAYQVTQQLMRQNSELVPEYLVLCSTASPEHCGCLPSLDGLSTQEALLVLERFNPAAMQVLQHPELAALFLPILRADFELCRRWAGESSSHLVSYFCISWFG